MKKVNAPKARRLPSGAWNCRVTHEGRTQSFTGPIRSEVEQAALQWKMSEKSTTGLTLGEAVEKYISKRSELSPSTIRRYKQFKQNDFLSLQRRALVSIRPEEYQNEINQMRKVKSPKTIENTWGFFRAVLKENKIDVDVTLPQSPQQEHKFLEPEEIPVFLAALKGNKQEIPILLGLHGMRRSEIAALTWDDIDLAKGRIHIHGAKVMDADGFWVDKDTTKNASSTRTIPIMIPRLKELLSAAESDGKVHGKVCNCYPETICKVCNRICERNGLPKIGAHGLRHSFVSLCYHKKIPELVTMRLGGYSDFQTMRRIYTHLAATDFKDATETLASFVSE